MDGRRPTNDTIRHGQEYNRERRVKNGVKKKGERESVSDDQREREERESVSDDQQEQRQGEKENVQVTYILATWTWLLELQDLEMLSIPIPWQKMENGKYHSI